MKNILLLSSSPRRRGNCDLLCEAFMKGAGEAGHQCTLVHLDTLDVEYCRACYVCYSTARCIFSDDMEALLDRIQSADVLVVATPTCFSTVSGRLKMVIDRFLPRYQELGGHEVYLIITGHDEKEGLELVEKEMRTIFEGLGNQVKDTIFAPGVWAKGEVLDTKSIKEAYLAGLNS